MHSFAHKGCGTLHASYRWVWMFSSYITTAHFDVMNNDHINKNSLVLLGCFISIVFVCFAVPLHLHVTLVCLG